MGPLAMPPPTTRSLYMRATGSGLGRAARRAHEQLCPPLQALEGSHPSSRPSPAREQRPHLLPPRARSQGSLALTSGYFGIAPLIGSHTESGFGLDWNSLPPGSIRIARLRAPACGMGLVSRVGASLASGWVQITPFNRGNERRSYWNPLLLTFCELDRYGLLVRP